MDTNENTGFQTPEGQEPTQKAPPSPTPRASAPKMDGVSAGGRPRRPDTGALTLPEPSPDRANWVLLVRAQARALSVRARAQRQESLAAKPA